MIKHSLQLDYTLKAGWLVPWAQALLRGEALARQCSQCQRVSFAPLLSCDCGHNKGAWVKLPGTATIMSRTEGADGAFALVQFTGADTQVVARLHNVGPSDAIGRMVAPGSLLPELIIAPESATTPSIQHDEITLP